MGYLKVGEETIYETDYVNRTIEYEGEVHEFDSTEEMDAWAEENLLEGYDSG